MRRWCPRHRLPQRGGVGLIKGEEEEKVEEKEMRKRKGRKRKEEEKGERKRMRWGTYSWF
jgi:hypothetical protein